MRNLSVLAIIIMLTHLNTPGYAATHGDAIISPDNTGQLITDWGYDIKQSGKATKLTYNYAQTLFLTDKITCLRIPIWGNSSKPAHPAPGVVIESYYSDILFAMQNARNVRQDLTLFASKKLQSGDSFPDWVKNSTGIIPDQYAILLADFLQYMAHNGFPIDILGIDNEMEYNEGNISPQKHQQTIDALKPLLVQRGLHIPLIIGPDSYGPKYDWVNTITANNWGDRLDIVGTHYYPRWRPISKLQKLVSAAQKRPVWHSEVHWDKIDGSDTITEGELALATLFDCLDSGLSGMVWWSYTRNNIKGGIEQAITESTIGTRPVDIDDIDGRSANTSTLITRAFRRGNELIIWIINNTSTQYNDYGFHLDNFRLTGPVTVTRWDTTETTTATAPLQSETSYALNLPAHTITMAKCYIATDALWAFIPCDGNLTDHSPAANHIQYTSDPPVFVNSQINQGVFLEKNQAFQISGCPGILGSSARSCTLWIKTSENGKFMSWGRNLPGELWSLELYYGRPMININSGYIIGETTLTDNQWHFLAVTLMDNTTDITDAKLYVDGRQESVFSSRAYPVHTESYDDIELGGQSFGLPFLDRPYFRGALDDIRLYNQTLNDEDIADLYYLGQPYDYICLPNRHLLEFDYNQDCIIDLIDLTHWNSLWLNQTWMPDFHDFSAQWLSQSLYRPNDMPTPVSCYRFEGNAQDSAGSNHGTVIGNPFYAVGYSGSCINFNGNDAIVINNPIHGDFTVVFWIQTFPQAPESDQWWAGNGLIDGEYSGTTTDFGISLNGSHIAFGLGQPDTTIKSQTPINDGWWHQVAVTRNSQSQLMQIYVDGKLENSITGPPGPRTTVRQLRIGSLQTQTHFFSGSLDEIYLYNQSLTQNQINQLKATP